ncbi:MAG: TolC family protein [Heliobacteriaceae bacterium]|jgi:outer membrane protein TolC|nr:TolC family protein [Heliobacteriaceae bacterium]
MSNVIESNQRERSNTAFSKDCLIGWIALSLTLLAMTFTPVLAKDIGNKINTKEYPSAQEVLPQPDFVIQGSVEKNLDMTLERCIEIALGNNPQIAAAFNDILASDVRIKQVWSNYFPQLSWQTGYTKIRNLQLSDAFGETLAFNYWLAGQISLQQMLYDFGVTANQATIRKLDYEAYKTTLGATVNDVIFQTKDAYYNLLYAFESRKVALDTVKKFEMFYNQAKAFYEIGMNPKVDVTIAEVNLSNAKLQLIQADNAVNIAVAKLNNVMGVPFIDTYDVQERLKYKPVQMSFDGAVKAAREARPELKLAELKVESARQTLQLTKKSYYPTIVAEGQLMVGGNHPVSNYGYNYGAYISFPTVNTMLIKNEIKEARFLYDKEIANAKNTQNQIYLEIQNAYLSLEEKRNQMPVAALGVKQAKENYELSYGRYRVGEGNPTELKDAQINYQQAQLQYYAALYQYNFAKASLEKAVGKNIVEEALPVELEE